jgi:hypothetical protein
MTKVLVTTGKHKGSKKIEIIDLLDPSNVCRPSVLGDYPFDQVAKASIGLLNNNTAMICGGWKISSPKKKLDDCFTITDNAIETNEKLTQPRDGAASVVLNGNTLWITGGALLDENDVTKTTTFVDLTGTSPGPDLPLEIAFHCILSLNDRIILLIGGHFGNGMKSKDTFYYNTKDKTWTEGPSLIIARGGHSCALFKSAKHGHTDTVIVTGGQKNSGMLARTDFLNLDSNSWTVGMY